MPTYQYRCSQCGHELEVVQKFSDPALTVCEECQGALRKVYNAVGVVFKGSGFYRTDSRAASGKGGADKPAAKGETSTAGVSSGASNSNSSESGGSKTSGSRSGSSESGGSAKTPASSTAA